MRNGHFNLGTVTGSDPASVSKHCRAHAPPRRHAVCVGDHGSECGLGMAAMPPGGSRHVGALRADETRCPRRDGDPSACASPLQGRRWWTSTRRPSRGVQPVHLPAARLLAEAAPDRPCLRRLVPGGASQNRRPSLAVDAMQRALAGQPLTREDAYSFACRAAGDGLLVRGFAAPMRDRAHYIGEFRHCERPRSNCLGLLSLRTVRAVLFRHRACRQCPSTCLGTSDAVRSCRSS